MLTFVLSCPQLRTLKPFDREVPLASLNVTITVRDSGGASGALSSSRVFEIAIDDLNDCRPVFAQSRYDFVVTEGQRINNVVGQVHARDGDFAAKNRRISYKVSASGTGRNQSKVSLMRCWRKLEVDFSAK